MSVRQKSASERIRIHTVKVRPELKESLMLTGDESIVDAQLFGHLANNGYLTLNQLILRWRF